MNIMATSEKQRFNDLLKGYLSESLSGEELSEFLTLIKEPENKAMVEQSIDRDLYTGIPAITDPAHSKAAFARLNKLAAIKKDNKNNIRHIGFGMRWAAAIAAIILISSTLYLITQQVEKKKKEIPVAELSPVGQPGHAGATLFLSSGDSLILENQPENTILQEGPVQLVRKNGSLEYRGYADKTAFNTITTGRGRQWELQLPDGSKVWLNASSSIRYPLAFAKDRLVEMTGEAYFEVVHDAKRTFRVNTGTQIVEDIGTSFNIKAYPDEHSIATTLLKGAVSITSNGKTRFISPGQQAVLQDSGKVLKIDSGVDLNSVIAWKNGIFSFQNASLHEVMDEISRWYDVDVQYMDNLQTKAFSGEIPRNLNLSQIGKGLEQSNIHLKIDTIHRKVLVYGP